MIRVLDFQCKNFIISKVFALEVRKENYEQNKTGT